MSVSKLKIDNEGNHNLTWTTKRIKGRTLLLKSTSKPNSSVNSKELEIEYRYAKDGQLVNYVSSLGHRCFYNPDQNKILPGSKKSTSFCYVTFKNLKELYSKTNDNIKSDGETCGPDINGCRNCGDKRYCLDDSTSNTFRDDIKDISNHEKVQDSSTNVESSY